VAETTPVVDSPPPQSTVRCPVVGIGASAGGLDAFNRFLKHLPPDTGYAFVLIQHLEASHPSSLSEILGRATKMPVVEARDNVAIVPNHVYVIPPNTELTVAAGVLRLAVRSQTGRHMPVDHFLQSLAEDAGTRAVGIVLSGNGADGAIGLKAVKDAGGVTFAQEPRSAEFASMPSAAIGAGGADLVLPPESMAAELARMAHHPYFEAAGASASSVIPGPALEEASLRAICDVIHESSGVDFSMYRQTTVRRRILRRLAVLSLTSVHEYVALLRGSPEERAALQRDLLIGVTSFFRDPKAFDVLKALVFPVITRRRQAKETIRIWVPGCATGEEAYSILIALLEFQHDSGTTFPVQIFASDINDAALEKARSGRYPAGLADDVSAERLNAFFIKIDGGYQVAKNLRERCLFSRHNLLDDPPFSKLDLVSCRNVLIYVDTIQRKVIPLFHYALVDDGFLMLGRSETTHHDELFAAIDPIQRIYAKRLVAKRTYESFARADRHLRSASAPDAPNRISTHLSRDIDRLLLSKYSPSGVVVDESLEILEFRGHPAPFLGPTAGKAGLHLLKQLSDTELFLTIETLIRETAATGESARKERVQYEADGRSGAVDVEVTSLQRREGQAFLVLFGVADAGAAGTAAAGSAAAAIRDAQISKLTRELEAARARLLSFIDDRQTSDDENQQIAEDALSANEELQSLTEELETAKEELQSTNEELLTVNQELESRNTALASALETTKSIVHGVPIPFIVIDGVLLVRQMNPAFLKTFGVPGDNAADQPFYEMCDGVWNVSSMHTRLDGLLAGARTFDPFEMDRAFPLLGQRTLVVAGVRLDQLGWMLLTIQDITDQRQAEKALHSSEERRRQSEKMETVGRLAGGIAHDFNNLLTVIIGNADLLADSKGLDQRASEEVGQIRESADKAAALTDQLLSFSRRKVLQLKVFDLNPVIADFERMLRRLLGERIKIAVRLSEEGCWIKADAAEIGRVVLNLCLNARDAMPAGGVITIETARVRLDQQAAAVHHTPPGRYVRLVVADTGVGMDAETRRRVFEPFFTTKDVSKGTGLGLPSALGIVQQSGGVFVVESELGQGTRFEVLLPATAEGEDAAALLDDSQC